MHAHAQKRLVRLLMVAPLHVHVLAVGMQTHTHTHTHLALYIDIQYFSAERKCPNKDFGVPEYCTDDKPWNEFTNVSQSSLKLYVQCILLHVHVQIPCISMVTFRVHIQYMYSVFM